VLHVIKGLGPGGAERLLVSLAAASAPDVEVDVAYVLPHKDHLVPMLHAVGATTHLVGGKRGLLDPRWPARLLRLVHQTRPDVVHIHSPAVASVVRILLRLRRSRPVIVSTEHNVWPSFGRITRVANGITLGLADARLAVSEEVRTSAWSRLRPGLDVAIQGIPVGELRARRSERAVARSSLGLDDAAVLVVTVANFREKKDYPTLLQAVAEVDDPRLRFLSVGQGPLESQLRDLHDRLGLGDRFTFLGYVPDPLSIVAAADVFVLTSRHEGLPIALLEAMALGVAPVVSAVGGIPEVVTDGVSGLLIQPGDAAGFGEAFRRLADDSAERARLGAAAAARAGDFDIAITERHLEDRYRALLARRRR
jgi:glycosyltransferase involved in cell wall biosynthesis